MSNIKEQFDSALAELRFDEARSLIDGMEPEEATSAHARRGAAMEEASERARNLANRIQALARSDHYAALLDIAADPATKRLLACASKEIRRGAEVHLRGATQRRHRAQGLARRHFQRVGEALDDFDPVEARKELSKVDDSWLDHELKATLGELTERVEQMTKETDELALITAEVLAEQRPERTGRRRGCLSSGLLLGVAAIAAAAIAAG